MNYHFSGEEEIDSPSLVYYQDVIEENLSKAIALAGSADRLWPHMKTHKTSALLKMQIERGIARFKCATIAEAELCAISGGTHVLVAYPLVGPAIARFIKLRGKFPAVTFWAMGDNLEQLVLLGKESLSKNQSPIDALIDVNLGMNRTGVLPEKLEEFYLNAIKIEGLAIKGFHCYDGHLTIKDLNERRSAASSAAAYFFRVKESLEKQGCEIPVIIMGGTPTFSCHRKTEGVFLSPGTFFLQDYGYFSKYSDLAFTPGAAILSRVVSHPCSGSSSMGGLFTLDTGSKAIATDPADRGVIADLPEAKPVFQSEEHWVWTLEGKEPPPIGKILYILPTHICPTSALYPGVVVVRNGKRSDYWEVGARNRKISV
jgi:D-serine deaminase-like pyridoxal phosphate-dependent protein